MHKSHKVQFTDEEMKEHFKIGREYNRQSTIRHNKLQKDLSTKIWLQHEALAAMPEHLRIEALICDETPAPDDRVMPIFDTPPIKDFDASLYMKDLDGDASAKRQ